MAILRVQRQQIHVRDAHEVTLLDLTNISGVFDQNKDVVHGGAGRIGVDLLLKADGQAGRAEDAQTSVGVEEQTERSGTDRVGSVARLSVPFLARHLGDADGRVDQPYLQLLSLVGKRAHDIGLAIAIETIDLSFVVARHRSLHFPSNQE